jgi:hypothetical protein
VRRSYVKKSGLSRAGAVKILFWSTGWVGVMSMVSFLKMDNLIQHEMERAGPSHWPSRPTLWAS